MRQASVFRRRQLGQGAVDLDPCHSAGDDAVDRAGLVRRDVGGDHDEDAARRACREDRNLTSVQILM